MRHVDPREARRSAERERLRRWIEARIESWIALLDRLDGDPDLEPTLGSPELPDTCFAVAWLPPDQERWSQGGDTGEREAENEHGGDVLDDGEETLGWPANMRQAALGANTADGDSTAPERHGRGFMRCGADDYEDGDQDDDLCCEQSDNGIADEDGAAEQCPGLQGALAYSTGGCVA